MKQLTLSDISYSYANFGTKFFAHGYISATYPNLHSWMTNFPKIYDINFNRYLQSAPINSPTKYYRKVDANAKLYPVNTYKASNNGTLPNIRGHYLGGSNKLATTNIDIAGQEITAIGKMFRDKNVYVNSGNNGRTYQAYFFHPSNGLGIQIDNSVITSSSFSTTYSSQIAYSLFYANQHFVSSTYSGLASGLSINRNWNDSSWAWRKMSSSATGADYSGAINGGLDRTGVNSGSRMRWIAYKRTYSANNNVFKNSDLIISDGTNSKSIVSPSPFVWGTHYEAYVYVPSIDKYANLRDSGGTTGAGDIYSSTSISAANDYTGGGALQRPDGIATGAAYIVPHTSPGSTDIYFIIGLKVDSNLYITSIPTTQYTN